MSTRLQTAHTKPADIDGCDGADGEDLQPMVPSCPPASPSPTRVWAAPCWALAAFARAIVECREGSSTTRRGSVLGRIQGASGAGWALLGALRALLTTT